MDAIWRAAGGKLDEIEAGVDAAANDTFISMMDAAALSDMEAFLDIAPNKNRTLEVRRKLVASYFVGANHIGAPEIKELVRGYTGDTPEVKFSKGRIYVCISPPDESAFFSSDIIECLLRKYRRTLRCHFLLATNRMYSQHTRQPLRSVRQFLARCDCRELLSRELSARRHMLQEHSGSGCKPLLSCREPSDRKQSARGRLPLAGLRTRVKPSQSRLEDRQRELGKV